jgi:hypothetical protein
MTRGEYDLLLDPDRPVIQKVLPHHTASEREAVRSGWCDPCWDEVFRRDDD